MVSTATKQNAIREASSALSPPELAVVIPVHDEAENVKALTSEVNEALRGRCVFEIIFVDDGSTDKTLPTLIDLAASANHVRVLKHANCYGQSAAIASGVAAARAPVIATIDGDGQNDPADIPRLFAVMLKSSDRDQLLVAGIRNLRQDSAVKRLSSRIANSVRAALLKDNTEDTGCGLKVFTRSAFLNMPRFDHMHRFLPALLLLSGGRVKPIAVSHRPRQRGKSKYGVFDRLWVGIVDILGVMWLQRRSTKISVIEVDCRERQK